MLIDIKIGGELPFTMIFKDKCTCGRHKNASDHMEFVLLFLKCQLNTENILWSREVIGAEEKNNVDYYQTAFSEGKYYARKVMTK